MICRRWEVASLAGGHAAVVAALADSQWARDEICIGSWTEKVRSQDREWLDAPVSMELAVFVVGSTGLVFYEGDDLIRSRPLADEVPLAAASVVRRYGTSFADEVLEKGSAKKPAE